jgi:hypothetical protein
LRGLFESVLVAAEPLIAEKQNLIVEIDASGAVASFQLPAEPQARG